MPDYQRLFIPGGMYFFTVVTFHRKSIFSDDNTRDLFHDVWHTVSQRYPFTTNAICLLPDHLHCIWTLPENDFDYPKRWREIKRLFSHAIQKRVPKFEAASDSRKKRGELSIWQRRYWEHCIRDEKDLEQHVNYIHFNPVKHGLVDRAVDWKWSSFHRYVNEGFYENHWGGIDGVLYKNEDFGE